VADSVVRVAGALLLMALLLGSVHAHDLGVARLVLTPLSATSVLLEAKIPARMVPTAPIMAGGCAFSELGQRPSGQLVRLATWRIDCDSGWPGGDAVLLDWQREGAMVVVQRGTGDRSAGYVDADGGIIRLNLDELLGNGQAATDTATRYVGFGIKHILLGIDHLAFVLALCLLARGWTLVKLVTAFTVGHSVTLALAVLGWVDVPVPPVEASIALSIVFVARAAMQPGGGGWRHGFWLVVAFGMLHGLGFASVLAEIGLPRNDLVLGLLSFNLGVEIGQLLFVFAVLSVQTAISRMLRSQTDMGWVRTATSFGIGSTAVFWVFERVAAFAL